MSICIDLGAIKVSGKYKAVVKNAKGEITREVGVADNMLLDYFFSSLTLLGNYACVGYGTTPSNGTEVGLESSSGIASKARTNGASPGPAGGNTTTGLIRSCGEGIYQWELGQLVGNFSEWGITTSTGNVSSNVNYQVRALFEDTNGDPTTLTLTADDQLEIHHTLYKHYPGSQDMSEYIVGTFDLDGVNTQVTAKLLNPNLFSDYAYFGSSKLANQERTCLAYPNDSYIGWYYVLASEALTPIVLAATAGSDITDTTSGNKHDIYGVNSVKSHDTSVPGQVTTTDTGNWPLNSGASDEPLGYIYFGTPRELNSFTCRGADALAVLTFSPAITKGPARIMSASCKYTVSRN